MQQTEAIVTWHGAKWREYEQPTYAVPRSSEPALISERILLALEGRVLTQSQIRDRVHAGSQKVKLMLQQLVQQGVLVRESGCVGQTFYRVAR